ncbi:hypothetical protein LOD99_15782 [Oopsacas minuta]|uniref:Uncharacterized protein n=1 Tax=Oopsacas minuta TaxID=111878 RepID=A0AAV7KDB6_9METZ|nr:hypothetical protein LOD99_15782 [Oopsacas minuta]
MEKIFILLCLSLFSAGIVSADYSGDICLVCYFTYFVLPILICIGLISLPVICICVYCAWFHKQSPWKETPPGAGQEKIISSVQIEEAPPAYEGVNSNKSDCNV